VLAVSCDSVHTQRVFADQQRLDYPLLSDFWPHGAVARSYGVFDETIGAALRGSFVIDRGGVVQWTVVNALPDARDVAAYQKVLAGL
jgi:peroxiredoxin